MSLQPLSGRNPIVANLQRQRGQVEQIRENSSRHAWCYLRVSTTGSGQFVLPDCQYFGTTFINQPDVATGVTVPAPAPVINTLTKAAVGVPAMPILGGGGGLTAFPLITSGVYDWANDDRGYYIGAYIFVVVQDLGCSQTQGTIEHSITLSGLAFKSLLTTDP